MRLMPRLARGSVELVLCDLPYGVTDCKWDRRIDAGKLWREYERVLAPGGAVVLFAQWKFSIELNAAAPAHWRRYEWIWDKRGASGWLSARRRPMVGHEMVLVFSPCAPRYFPQGLRPCARKYRKASTSEVYHGGRTPGVQRLRGYPTTLLRFARERGARPAQKPVALLEYLIRTYTREGETVLDNTMGLGSTGVAAVRCGRRFVGMEMDRERFAEARRRIAEERRLTAGAQADSLPHNGGAA